MAKANVIMRYTVLVEYKNVDVCEYNVPDIPDPIYNQHQVQFDGAKNIMEVEIESEDVDLIIETDERLNEQSDWHDDEHETLADRKYADRQATNREA